MPDSPTFLPAMLNLDGEWSVTLERLYAVFSRDFKETKAHHNGLRVIYNGLVKPDGQGKEEGFWHVISRDDKSTGERLPDYPRAKRLPWAKPIMESRERPEIKLWQYKEGPSDSGIRTYIWLENYDYLIILQKKKNIYYWVTAFYVDSDGRKADLRRKYEKRL